jgi:hypothetical protein
MSKETKILVGVPIPTSYMCDARIIAQIEAWHAATNVETYYPSTGSPMDGQHKIVDFALYGEPRATHILFLDYDVLPKADALSRLLAHDKDIVSGVYPLCKGRKIKWCLSKDEPFTPMPFGDLPDKLFEAKSPCNGMMLVKTEVFENIKKPYWETVYDQKDNSKSMGADLNFFVKAREAGYKLWVDPQVKCEHFRTVGLLGIAQNYETGRANTPPIIKE